MTNSFEPVHNINEIYRGIDDFVDYKTRKSIEILSYIGEQFENTAKQDGSYTDQTANLRNSIGYVVVVDGKIKKNSFPNNMSEADQESIEHVKQLAENYSGLSKDSPVLIGVAGMEYAAAVESKGYEVISNSADKAEEILKRVIKELEK